MVPELICAAGVALDDGRKERIGGGTMDTVQGFRRGDGGSTTLPDVTLPIQ
jgi:hypothetical protein